MATLLFSEIVDGAELTFDPASDVLSVDDVLFSAAQLQLSFAADLTQIVCHLGDKSFSLPPGVSLLDLTDSNVLFADGSQLRFGDDMAGWLYGAGLSDQLRGLAGDDVLDGEAGADTLLGGDGADVLRGGAGDDMLDGGSGADKMYGGLGDDTYIVDSLDDTVSEAPASSSVDLMVTGTAYTGTYPQSELSADGRYIVANSSLQLLAADSDYAADVYIKDTWSGEVTLVSTGNNDVYPRGSAQVSADGRYVVYTNSDDQVMRRDTVLGTTEAVSVSESGVAGNGYGSDKNLAISADGRYVVFDSNSDNLVADDVGSSINLFLKDMQTGTVQLISLNEEGDLAWNDSYTPRISADGRYVVFQSLAVNYAAEAGYDGSNLALIIKDLQTGEVERVTSTSGQQTYFAPDENNFGGFNAQLSGDGRYVVFNDREGSSSHVMVKDRLTGEVKCASTDQGWGDWATSGSGGEISDDGRYVVFSSTSSKLVAGDTNNRSDVFVKDMQTGAIKLVSQGTNGLQLAYGSFEGDISADGRWISFAGEVEAVPSYNSQRHMFKIENPFLSGGTDTVKASVSYTLGSDIENLVLTGSAHINGSGNALANVITGNNGNNVLNGGQGADILRGGLGNDTYVQDGTDTIEDEGGLDTVQAASHYVLGTGIENLTLTGSAAINGTGNALANLIVGNNGKNVLKGGAGNDTYTVTAGDTVTELVNAGTDKVQSAVTWVLGANIENLTLTGSAAINGTGNALNNVIAGNNGKNNLQGGLGNDTYLVGTGDTVTESANAGVDIVQSSVTWVLANNIENLTLTGSAAINGSGNTLNNVLIGNVGNNVLNGGLGKDTLTGGTGKDSFRFDTTLNASTNLDTIADFKAVDDTILLENAIFKKLVATGTLKASSFKASTSGNATDADDFILYETDTGKLFYDADGSGAGAKVQFALLGTSTHPVITAADFSVV